jgi:hypothetical protein
MQCVRVTVAEGPMSMVRGSWPLILRTIPMEALTFIGYDMVALAHDDAVIKYPSPLNVLQDVYGHRCY